MHSPGRCRLGRRALCLSLHLVAGSAFAGIIQVPQAQPTIQAAIAAAAFQDTILVAPGTYHETIDLLGKTIHLESAGGPDATIIDGDGAALVVKLQSELGASITGFTIRNGVTGIGGSSGITSMMIVDCIIRDCTGDAAIDMPGKWHPTLRDCTVTANAGLGVRATTAGTQQPVRIEDSTISHNGTGGIEGTWLVISGSTIEANGGYGARLTTNGELLDCTVIDNTGTGALARNVEDSIFAGNGGWGLEVLVVTGGGTLVRGSRFLGNALGGVHMESYASFGPFNTVDRCIFAHGDGLWSKAANTSGTFANGSHNVTACSFEGGAGISFLSGDASVAHIVRGAGITLLSPFTTLVVHHSDVEGGAAGPGNIDADPLWADAAADDFSLLPGSPCIDAGDRFEFDPDGSVKDMGAVPYQPWTELGAGLAGLAGVAHLAGSGSLVDGAPIAVELSGAPASQLVTLFLGVAQLGAQFKGGTMWPAPFLAIPGLVTTNGGSLSLAGTWPGGLPSGTTIWLQLWWSDAGGPQGVASSNGLRATQP
jgi:hypothetical protein